MDFKTFYNEVVTDHNMHPLHKHAIENPDFEMEGVNPSCGDEITLQLKVKDGVITEGGFVGDGCAISQASADIMIDMVIGKKTEEALHLADLFIRMIKSEASPEEIDELQEAGALADISHMPARVKCAVLGWHTLDEMIGKKD
ncbi:MAG: SUF system NifU family Fe-S cluster assembly protein [Lachnospiraceae bacterium]|nr:SUF system NifU family Fe-S cluster assembly protein [Lachnospiraceae bacterium]MBP3753788.1 SUF system NifU family Fe-S cluster assembly protein [Lachnospiraceae bacterium]